MSGHGKNNPTQRCSTVWLLFTGLAIIITMTTNTPVAYCQVLEPPNLNLAERKTITASSTCGEMDHAPEMYCRLTGVTNSAYDNLVIKTIPVDIQAGQLCEYCDAKVTEQSHPAHYAVDGSEKWWQSPPLSRGIEYNEVNLTVDLGQEFLVSYVLIKMANSPRPGAWVLERSTDFGQMWSAWQYFAETPSECQRLFNLPASNVPIRDDQAICTTKFSQVVPLEHGEIIVSLVDNRPNAQNFYNSPVLRDWTRANAVRMRLLQTKTLLGHLMQLQRQDPTVTRRYFYSIKDISIGGRCLCNGHAESCDKADPHNPDKLLCNCQHNTCGPQCEKCCPGYEQKQWKPVKINEHFMCEACNCHQHSMDCEYDPEVNQRATSLDINGRYSGGGVCKDCQHFTEGINCEKCRAGYYHDASVSMTSVDACRPCRCRGKYSTGDCNRNTGQCLCKTKYAGRNCERCNIGYYNFPRCIPCDCNQNATSHYVCQIPRNGQCPCKPGFGGKYCRQCSRGYFNYPQCQRCRCNSIGSRNNECNSRTGKCYCHSAFAGSSCDQCAVGYYIFPRCNLCNCDVVGCTQQICNNNNGRCHCKSGFTGARCDQCKPGFYQYPYCRECRCSAYGSLSPNCGKSGQCPCKRNFGGTHCDRCAAGYFRFPNCVTCNCSATGSIGQTCDQQSGKCKCQSNFDGLNCERCKPNFYMYQYKCVGRIANQCNCNPAGAVEMHGHPLGGCGATGSHHCKCKDRVLGRTCDTCKPGFWDLNIQNPLGCIHCQCNPDGIIGGVDMCNEKTGQCMCKPAVTGRKCAQCSMGTYKFERRNPFGCRACDCNLGGSVTIDCDKSSGQCQCKPRIEGPKCDTPERGYYFPSLHQHKYEIEDGYQPGGGKAHFAFNEQEFPAFSWKGYAIMSIKQAKVILDINIKKPTLHRIVVRYVNKESRTINGQITITPKAQVEMMQMAVITFRPASTPQWTKLIDFGSTFVMDPGQWMLSISTPPGLLLDYLVLIPQQYYEASILQYQIKRKCIVPSDNGPCLHYTYLQIPNQPTATYKDAYVKEYGVRDKARELKNSTIISDLKVNGMALIDGNSQSEIHFDLEVPIPGRYILLVNYFNPSTDARLMKQMLHVSTTYDQSGSIELYNCPYSSMCRQIVKQGKTVLAIFDIAARIFTVTFKADQGHAYIQSVIAVPYEDFNLGMVRPSLVCIRVKGKCISTRYYIPGGSILIEAEKAHAHQGSTDLPPGVTDPDMKLVKLDRKHPTLDLSGTIRSTGKNVLIAQYHQPSHPGFPVSVNVHTNDDMYSDGPASVSGSSFPSESPRSTGIIMAKHCSNPGGCRAVVHFGPKGVPEIDLKDNNVRIKINSSSHDFWLDYFLLVPSNQYTPENLGLDPHDLSGKFLKNCVDQSLVHRETPECKDLLSALSSNYNNGALPCDCDKQGSLAGICDPQGGQCRCRSNIIGRDCSACKAGYFGFPNCQRCDCKVGLCHPENGQCICPPRVTGKNCDQCLPKTYGYDPYVGCEECGCDPNNVQSNLNCNQNTGQCNCQHQFGGRTCNMCASGYHSHPQCSLCTCDIHGAEEQICNPDNGQCLCKKNVVNPQCGSCKSGTFHLEQKNPNGCTTCFCFGITTSCSKSDLRLSNVTTVKNWNIHNTIGVSISSSTFIKAKVGPNRIKNELEAIYWSAPSAYLGNKITSYGSIFKYNLLFMSDTNGVETEEGPDVILVGNNMSLAHKSQETPVNNQMHEFSVDLREYEFVHEVLGNPVKRDQFMMVLAHLEGIYIKGSYLSNVQEMRLSNICMGIATRNGTGALANTVEKCDCPPSYRGTSCEKCAPGHSRRRKSPFFGTCAPCECNRHTKQCDSRTGECLNCDGNTMGHYCHLCKPGYHGNPAIESCKICACPLSVPSNNFAASCLATEGGRVTRCECKRGYSGLRCNKCSIGFYGDPMTIGGSCKECQCKGNLNMTIKNSCHPETGKCLNCTNNASGENCELCKPGWYGDAIHKKNCKPCQCKKCGTKECDNKTGDCVCLPWVIGLQCDRCKKDYFGFDVCKGCTRCACALASLNSKCDMVTGQCNCPSSVTGRMCEACLDGYWNYYAYGCQRCNCSNRGVASTCDEMTGECICKKGYAGDLCENCTDGWVPIKGEGCRQCDNCTKPLLEDLEESNKTLSKLYKMLRNASVGIIAQQKLKEIEHAINTERPKVDHLLKHGGANTPDQEVSRLKDEVDDLLKKVHHTEKRSADILDKAKELRDHKLKPHPSDILKDINRTIDYLNGLHSHGGTSDRDVQRLLIEAERIRKEILKRNFDDVKRDCDAELEMAKKALEQGKNIYKPAVDQENRIKERNETINEMVKRLKDLQDKSKDAKKHASETWDILKSLNYYDVMHAGENIHANISALESILKMSGDHLNDTRDANKAIKNYTQDLHEKLSQLDAALKKVNIEFKADLENKLAIVKPIAMRAIEHPESLLKTLKELENVYNKNTSQRFLDAANAYKNIINAINDALAAAKKASDDSTNAQKKSRGVGKKAMEAKRLSQITLIEAMLAYNTSQDILKGLHANAMNVTNHVKGLNSRLEKELDGIKNTFQGSKAKQINLKDQAQETANKTQRIIDKSDDVMNRVDHILTDLPEDRKRWNQTIANIQYINQTNMNTYKQLNTAKALLPNINLLVQDLYSKLGNTRANITNALADVKALVKMIETARSEANAIIVGLRFFPNTTLRLRNPPEQFMSDSYNKITMYVRTNSTDGLLAYVGRPFIGKTSKQDFLALELIDKNVVFSYNLGSGKAVITNPTKVNNDKWYYIEAKRIGISGTLLVEGDNYSRNVSGMSKGIHSVLEVNPEQTYIYVGGFPTAMDYKISNELSRTRYDGAMALLTFNDYRLGLWNFIEGANNNNGYRNRNSKQVVHGGYRFTGRSYADLKNDFNFRTGYDIKLSFNSFKPDGLLLLMFDNVSQDFASLDMRQGYLVYQYDLGSGRAFIKSNETFNDGKWHKVTIKRNKTAGKMFIDDLILIGSSKGSMNELSIKRLFIGGYEDPLHLPRTNVSDYGFNGCIKNVQIGSNTNVFKESNLLFEMNPGCLPPIARAAKFTSHGNNYVYGSYDSSLNSFLVTMKFKSYLNNENGLLLYINLENDPNKMFAIYMEKGYIQIASRPQNKMKKLKSALSNYGDGNWHHISAMRDNKKVKLNIDDQDENTTDFSSAPFGKINLYFGGVSNSVNLPNAIPKENFHGCIEDVTINGMFFNFASLSITGQVQLNQCQQERSNHKSTTVRPTLPPITPLDKCHLPLIPESPANPVKMGLRFGSSQSNSHWELDVSLKDTRRNSFLFNFRTLSAEAILLYAADANHNDFISVYLQDGQVVYAFDCGTGKAISKTANRYNDGAWHKVEIIREVTNGKLVVDDTYPQRVISPGKSTELNIIQPVSFAGISHETQAKPQFTKNLPISNYQLVGCLRDIKVLDKDVDDSEGIKYNVKPCYKHEENGAFIGNGGGIIIAEDNFTVGSDMEFSMLIKPRTINGILASVYSNKHNFFLLQLHNGSVHATFNNGAGEFSVQSEPKLIYQICNGQWHTIKVNKYKQACTLIVDGTQFGPHFSIAGASFTKTADPLYIGGIPALKPKLFVRSNEQYVGCIKNLVVSHTSTTLYGKTTGNVHSGLCSTL